MPPSHPLNDGRSMKLETWLRLFADRGTPHEVPLVPVRELVAGPAVAVDRATSLREAARIMRSRRVSSLLVDHGKAIVTERDITRAIGAGGHPTETVETVATAAPIRVDSSLSVIAAGHVMLDEQVRHLVVTMSERWLGIVSMRDVVGFLLEQADRQMGVDPPVEETSEYWMG